MKWIIVGLGNPGGEYDNTRHNVGRMVLEHIRCVEELSDWEMKKSWNALSSLGTIAKQEVLCIEPETFMNNSGKSLLPLVKSKKQASQLVVLHDDIDLPLGRWKFAWNRGSGGHKGIESIMRLLKTKEFVRMRIGVSPENAKGVARKPKGEEAVIKFVLGKFKEDETKVLKKVSKEINEAVAVLVKDGLDAAMNQFN